VREGARREKETKFLVPEVENLRIGKGCLANCSRRRGTIKGNVSIAFPTLHIPEWEILLSRESCIGT